MAFLVDGKKQLLLLSIQELLGLILVQLHFRQFRTTAIGGVHLGFEQSGMLGLALLHSIKQQTDLVLDLCIFRFAQIFDELVGFANVLVAQPLLLPHQVLDARLELGVQTLILLHLRRTTDDQRRAGFINKDRVHLIHNGKVMAALHLFLGALSHAVVAQIIEAHFRVGAVGDVAVVHFPPGTGWLVMLDATHGQSQESVKRSHPFGVTSGQVIVHRHHMHAAAGQGIQVNRQGGYEGFTFTSRHLGNVSFMQGVTADELYIEVNHFPEHFMAAHINIFAAQPPSTFLHHREGLRHNFIQPQRKLVIILDRAQLLLPRAGLTTEFIIRHGLQLIRVRINLLDQGFLDTLDLAVVFRAKNFLNKSEHIESPQERRNLGVLRKKVKEIRL